MEHEYMTAIPSSIGREKYFFALLMSFLNIGDKICIKMHIACSVILNQIVNHNYLN